MTKPLTPEEKKQRKKERKEARRMQKAPSTTSTHVQVPKAEGPDQAEKKPEEPVNLCDSCAYEYGECEGTPIFAGEGDDRVVKCSAFQDVDLFPTVGDQEDQGPDSEDETELTEEVKERLESIQDKGKPEEKKTDGLTPEEKDEAVVILKAEAPLRPDIQRFEKDKTDYGPCPSCQRPLKRTAFNRYRDAIRCTNPRCRAYRQIVRTISTGVK